MKCPLMTLNRHALARPRMSAFGGESGYALLRCTCLLLTQSGHSLARPVYGTTPLVSRTANVSPMKYVNRTRTNVINRLRIHEDLRAFFDSDALS